MLGDFTQPLPLPVVCPACMRIMSLRGAGVAARNRHGGPRFSVRCVDCGWTGWTRALAGPEAERGRTVSPSLGTQDASGPASDVEGHRVVSLAAHRERRAS